MPKIRPVSDLRNNFTEISRIIHEEQEPIFLTKNGFGDMVVMSIEQYERQQFGTDVFFKLKEAENEAKMTTKRYTHVEIMQDMQEKIAGGK